MAQASATAALKAPGIGDIGEGQDGGTGGDVVVPISGNHGRTTPLTTQEKVSVFYNSNTIQVVVACIISANFATNIVEKQVDPTGVKYSAVFTVFELFYNIAFTIE